MKKQSKIVFESPTAEMISMLINRSDKKQTQISEEIGLSPKSNALTVFKQGRSPLPISRCLPLAKACDASPEETKLLISTCLRENYPDIADIIQYVSGDGISAEERVLIDTARKVVDRVRNQAKEELIASGKWKDNSGEIKPMGRQTNESKSDPLPSFAISQKSSDMFKSFVENFLIKKPRKVS